MGLMSWLWAIPPCAQLLVIHLLCGREFQERGCVSSWCECEFRVCELLVREFLVCECELLVCEFLVCEFLV